MARQTGLTKNTNGTHWNSGTLAHTGGGAENCDVALSEGTLRGVTEVWVRHAAAAAGDTFQVHKDTDGVLQPITGTLFFDTDGEMRIQFVEPKFVDAESIRSVVTSSAAGRVDANVKYDHDSA